MNQIDCSLQDFATWVQVVLNVITIGVLILAWRAAIAQANAAKEQAQAAEKLTVISEEQRKAGEASAAAAKEQSALIKAQLEESLRPLLVYEEGGGVVTSLPCSITNQGKGMALDIAWWYGRADAKPRCDQPVSVTILGPEHVAKIIVDSNQVRSKWMTIQYRSTDGRRFQTFVTFSENRLLQVQHFVDPSVD